MVPSPFAFLPGALFILMLAAGIGLVTIPSLRPWRTIGWVLLAGVLVLFGAALIWTFTIDVPPT